MSFINDKIFFSDAGYSSTVVSKRGSKYDIFENRHVRMVDYDLKDMQKAEKNFIWLSKALANHRVGNVLGLVQVKPNDRSAIFYFKDSKADYYINNFMTFHLQKGKVFNLPINRMRINSGKPLTKLAHDDLVEGIDCKSFIKVMDKYLKSIEDICNTNKIDFTSNIIHLSLLGLNNKFVFDVKVWNDFLSHGIEVSDVAFALDKELNPSWQNGILNVTPEFASGLKNVPQDWVRHMLIN